MTLFFISNQEESFTLSKGAAFGKVIDYMSRIRVTAICVSRTASLVW